MDVLELIAKHQPKMAIPSKSVSAIIDETVAHYSTCPRAVKDGAAVYADGTGAQCAVGRCLTVRGLLKLREDNRNIVDIVGGHNNSMYEVVPELDKLLRPEYQGKPAAFWSGLQYLHDSNFFWEEGGLTKAGELFCAQLRATWA